MFYLKFEVWIVIEGAEVEEDNSVLGSVSLAVQRRKGQIQIFCCFCESGM